MLVSAVLTVYSDGVPCLVRVRQDGSEPLKLKLISFDMPTDGKCIWQMRVGVAQAAKTGRSHRHPYDLGLYGNISSTCGPRPSKWLVPDRRSAHGDGLSFPTYLDDDLDVLLTGRRL